MSSIFNTPPNTTDPMELLRYFQELRDSRIDTFRKSTSQFPSVFNRPERLAEDTNEKGNNYLASIFDSLSVQTAEAVEQVGPTIARIKEEQKQEQILNKLNLEDTSFRKEEEAIDGSVTDSTNIPGINTITTDGNSAGKVIEPVVDGFMSDQLEKRLKDKGIMSSSSELSDSELIEFSSLPDLAKRWKDPIKTDLAFEEIFKFIQKGEGGFESSNRGTIKKKIQGSTSSTVRNGKKLTEMTLGEIKKLQEINDPNDKNRLFAVGRFQMIPEVIIEAQKATGISDDTIFNAVTQNKMGRYLITDKRKTLKSYLAGDSSVSTDQALLSLSKEFASFPVPKNISVKRDDKLVAIKKGQSYYGGANKAHHDLSDVRSMLESVRGKIDLNSAPRTSSRPMSRSGDSLMAKTTPIKKPTSAIKVKKGQTLGGIAKANNTTVAKLKEANGIEDENKINVGQSISIPKA